jgi:hypothetical protein
MKNRRRSCDMGLSALLAAVAVAGCSSDRPAPPDTPTALPSLAQSSATRLAPVPECDDLVNNAAGTLRGLRKFSEVPSSEDPAVTIRISCLYDGDLAVGDGHGVTVEIEAGRYATEPGGRTGDEIAVIPMRERVRATCTAVPTSIEGSFAAAQECTNTDGLARSGAGFVKGGSYATAEIVVKDEQQPSAAVRAAVAADARRLAGAALDRLG